ncbi:flavodoxin family protein [Marinilactibacillus sp. Marseille-P9653]|uniref:flavodoxin family protein n=1 Tax=Marinilactibacillus sp. Marseille-P9653 TaxID=2866583 RepID=UPI001CE3E995|nr:NAD(P)H-dependent oxidoreductase [Marinilactibacillus sp. Marseille-P9653]
MEKIFIFNSSLKKSSRIYTYTESIKSKFSDCKIYDNNLYNTTLFPHNGDTSFYETGVHYQDSKDDVEKIKHEMLDSDLIILATPVYCHMASSGMVMFIERIFSLWVHFFKLVGKPCIIITTSESNGNEKVIRYLSGILETAGANVEDAYTFMNTYDNEEENMERLTNSITKILENHNPKFSHKQEAIFKTYKRAIGRYDETNYEYQYWEKSGLFSSKSLKEYNEIVNP